MVALRLYAVGLLLMPVWAEAAAPWNSTDMSYKLIADQKIKAQKSSELQALRAASATADSRLSGNQTILKGSKEALLHRKNTNTPLADEISAATRKLQQAQTDMAQKGNVLNESIENATETKASLKQATAALSEAQTALTEKTSANYTASEELIKATNALEQAVVNNPAAVPAAKANVDLKKTALANASAALAKAEKVLAAKTRALGLANATYQGAVHAQVEAERVYQDAVGHVDSLSSQLAALKVQDATPASIIANLTAAVEKQEGVVETLDNISKELHKETDAKNLEFENISNIVKFDIKCISRLQAGEGTLAVDTLRFKKAADAYEATPQGAIQEALKPALWQLKDQKDVATRALWEVQNDCATPNITLPEEPPLPDCHDSTGGTCRWFNCHASRHAECCDNNHAGQPFCPDGPTFTCLCPAGTCAVDGVCQDRGSPVLLASPSTELRAEPAAASTVLLAAAALTVTALLVMRRRRTPEIHMPEYVLG